MAFTDAQGRALDLVVRALIVRQDRLLVCRLRGGYCFAVGGRVEHGETLEQALQRELLEETGAAPAAWRLVYFHENHYHHRLGHAVHELGWYYHVEPLKPIADLAGAAPHPDSPDLTLEYEPLARLGDAGLVPGFLAERLPADLAQGFPGAPRHLLSIERPGQPAQVHELPWSAAPGGAPGGQAAPGV